jgi:HK97 family phage prohead protease
MEYYKIMIRLTPTQITVDAAAAEGLPSRSISGVAVTYDETATVNDGTQVRFLQGSLPVTGRDPKLYMQHDANQIVGKVVERVDTPQGMMFTAKISSTRLGDEALTLANDGVIDAVSVGVTPTKFSYDEEGVMIVEAATWSELSLVSEGAFAGAVITEVAASAPDEVAEGIPETELTSAIQSDQEPTQEIKDMTDKKDETVVEAAQATTEKLWAQPARKFNLPTPGEYMAAMHIGGTTFQNVAAATREFVKANQSALQAAAGDIATTDTPGIIPTPVLGPVFQDLNFIRPVVNAVGARAMPNNGASKTFVRPTITTHTSVAAQTAEFDAASATTMVIASNTVSKTTLAGQVTLSIQDVDFTDPAALNIVLNDLVGKYMLASDNVAADAITAGATASGATWTVNTTDPSSLMNALYVAAYNILTATNFLPDHIFVDPNVWVYLGKQLDGDKRPIFPYVGAAGLQGINAGGTANITQMSTFNPFGLKLVADNQFAALTMVVARGEAIEFYEQVRGLMSVELPSTLGRNFSYAGYVSTFIADSTQVQSVLVV